VAFVTIDVPEDREPPELTPSPFAVVATKIIRNSVMTAMSEKAD
jgi:hypothetical protein